MRAWPAPQVPNLKDDFGSGPAVRAFDSATGRLETIDPDGTARMYVCGITPYDATHLGHAATYLAYDLLQRAWLDRGLAVEYVQNVTDIDDPLLDRAAETGAEWTDLAEVETQNYRIDMQFLRVLPPAQYVGVVESLDRIRAHIGKLEAAGATYALDGDLYFDVTAAATFGQTFGVDPAEMIFLFDDRGGDPDRPGKRNALDSLLWKAADGEGPSWPSPWGEGRPGWHIECTSIALDCLGAAFDVQGGGADLAFPHHEMTAAQSLVTGSTYANHYVHASMVGYRGEKMSKSLGNLVLVSALRSAGHEYMAIRLALLAHHYRSDWEWVDDEINAAEERLKAWRQGITRSAGPAAAPLVDAIRTALTDDLDAPTALAVVDEWCATDGDDPEASTQVARVVDALLGVDLVSE